MKIVIRTPNWLGDLMMSTAFIEAVLDQYPNARVDLIVRKGFEDLPLPHRGKILPFQKKEDGVLGFGKRLKKEGYQKIFVLPPSFSSALMAFRAGIPERIGYQGDLRGLFLSPAKSYTVPHRTRHLITEYLELLDSPVAKDYFPKLAVDNTWAETCLKNHRDLPDRFVTFSPGAMYGPAKQWPVEHFKKLAELLARQEIATVITGTAGDQKLGEKIARENPLAINKCGKTGLNELIAILQKSRLLVSNDSGTMHLMSALRKPQIAIFGSTSTTWTAPKNDKARILTLNLPCAPCYKRECPLQHYSCLKKLSAETVFNTLREILNR